MTSSQRRIVGWTSLALTCTITEMFMASGNAFGAGLAGTIGGYLAACSFNWRYGK